MEILFLLANSIDFSIVRKWRSKPLALEALFLGQARLLEDHIAESYFIYLKREYRFL